MSEPGPWRSRWQKVAPYAVPSVVFLLIVLAVFWRLWTPIQGARKLFTYDAIWTYWADLQFQFEAYADGEFPLWNPYDRSGYPFHADPQPGLLYPVNWLLLGIASISGPELWLVALKIILHFWLAGVGMYALLRHRKLPTFACYAGGIFFILTYPFTLAMFTAIIWGMAWLPWVLLALDVWAERPTAGRAAALGLVVGLSLLAGGPAGFWYALIVAVPYGIWAVSHHATAADDTRAYLRTAAWTLGVAGTLFICIVGAQLSATGALIGNTVRNTRDLSFIGTTAFRPADLFGFVVPRMPGVGSYVSIIALFWIGAVVTIQPTMRRLVLLAIAIAGVLFALGNFGGFLPLSASTITPFGFFRRAHRYLFVTMPPLAILGAEGLALLAALDTDEAKRRAARAVLGVAALGVVLFGVGVLLSQKAPTRPDPLRDAYTLGFAATIVSAWVTYMVISKTGTWQRRFMAISAVVLLSDLWFACYISVERNFCDPNAKVVTHAGRHCPFPTTDRDKEVLATIGDPVPQRVYDREYIKYRAGTRLHIRDFGGYEDDPLALRRYATLMRPLSGSPHLLGHANVGFFMEDGRKILRKNAQSTQALAPIRRGVWKVRQVAPAVMWIDQPKVVENEAQALATLRATAPGTVAVLERTTLDEAELARAHDGRPDTPAVAGRIIQYGRNHLVAELDAPDDGLVVFHESYYPGWTATVDEDAARVVPANVAFRGVFVSAGHHRITLRYKARSYLVLFGVSIVAMLLAVFMIVLERKSGPGALLGWLRRRFTSNR